MHPLTFVKNHPVATFTLMAAGMVVGPAILRTVNNVTGVSVGLPSVGNGGG
jgi:hypothetical protein